MCHHSQVIFTWPCALLGRANHKYMQVVPTLYVSLAVAAGFIDLPLDGSCLRASCTYRPVTGRRLLKETRAGVPHFQGSPCCCHGARHNQPFSSVCQNTLWESSAQRFIVQQQRTVEEVIILSAAAVVGSPQEERPVRKFLSSCMSRR